MDIDNIVAGMPKAENPHTEIKAFVIFGAGVGAQCQLLAERRWRKVPSINKLVVELSRVEALRDLRAVTPLAEELHRWLLEEGNEGRRGV